MALKGGEFSALGLRNDAFFLSAALFFYGVGSAGQCLSGCILRIYRVFTIEVWMFGAGGGPWGALAGLML